MGLALIGVILSPPLTQGRVDSKSIITTIIEKFRHTYTHTLEDFVKVKAMNGVTPAQFRNV